MMLYYGGYVILFLDPRCIYQLQGANLRTSLRNGRTQSTSSRFTVSAAVPANTLAEPYLTSLPH